MMMMMMAPSGQLKPARSATVGPAVNATDPSLNPGAVLGVRDVAAHPHGLVGAHRHHHDLPGDGEVELERERIACYHNVGGGDRTPTPVELRSIGGGSRELLVVGMLLPSRCARTLVLPTTT